jgi:hypothetical protein
MPSPDRNELEAWRVVCRNVAGLATATTIAVAEPLLRMLEADELELEDVQKGQGWSDYAHVALRLLVGLGLVEPRPNGAFSLSFRGRALIQDLQAFEPAEELCGATQAADSALPGDLDPATERALGELSERLETVAPWVYEHLAGFLLAPAALALDRDPERVLPDVMSRALERARWTNGVERTALGRCALGMAAQYLYPLSYLPTFARVPRLVRTGGSVIPGGPAPETHVDRALDIRFSGLVFRRVALVPLLEVVLPLFDTADPADQPAVVVDTGCGDGSLLVELYRQIASRTVRAGSLSKAPLTMVGVEYSPVARRAAADRLAAAGVPHAVMEGDVASPDLIASGLRDLGFRGGDVLHVSKSVMHDRAYTGAPPLDPGASAPTTGALFLDENGRRIAPEAMLADLVEHFRRWQPHVGRHGIVVIEAHTANPTSYPLWAAGGIAVALDAAHLYSNQYLVEAEVHRWAMAEGGLRTRRRRDLSALVGAPLMTLDYLGP